jgi:hypothetical protein
MEMLLVIFYAFLGLLAFIYPTDVREAKSWLDNFDNLAFFIVVIEVFISHALLTTRRLLERCSSYFLFCFFLEEILHECIYVGGFTLDV